MKSMKKIYFLLIVILFLNPGCSDLLDEEPRALLTPDLFETAQGLEGGLIAAYSYLKFYYGSESGGNLTVYGTDEFTNGGQVSEPPLNIYRGIDPDNGDILTPWNRAYPAINTLNGVIELAPEATDLSEEERSSLVAEAKCLRAEWYFILVKTFGGVTLDLGSGPLRFNRTPSANFSRASLSETYAAIISDLEDAVKDLPEAPKEPGRMWKATALDLLAKAYLTRGWSEAAESGDFQKALDAAAQLIPNPESPNGNYGTALLSDYEKVFEEGNEFNSEVLHTANRIGNLDFDSFDTDLSGDLTLAQNRSNFFFRMFYTDFPGMVRDVENGRMWVRYKPTDWLLYQAFNHKDVDSRYQKSFQTVWIANDDDLSVYPVWTEAEANAGYVDPSKVGERKFTLGDTAVWILPDNISLTENQIRAKGYTVLTPEEVSVDANHYPSLKKYDAKLRPVSGTDDDPNIASYRPFIVNRLAETYLVAAEAAHKIGDDELAAKYINTIRKRAAWPGQESEIEISAADVDIDFILDERSRELAGEQKRWFDLVRTGKLKERAEEHNRDVTQIEPHHLLRPIPQEQINLSVGDYPQNPGYF